MTTLWEQVLATSAIQWLATIFSMVYILFAVRNQAICFLFGLIASVLWAYESYFNLNIKYDAALQVFYVLMSLWGLYMWIKGGVKGEERAISSLSLSANVVLIVVLALLSYVLYLVGTSYIETSLPLLDMFTTVFSIFATLLLVYRFIDNWIYWIVIDILLIGLYLSRGAPLFALIMLIYSVMAIIGYFKWKRIYLDKV